MSIILHFMEDDPAFDTEIDITEYIIRVQEAYNEAYRLEAATLTGAELQKWNSDYFEKQRGESQKGTPPRN